jgi:hypothetical protein
MIYPIRKTIIIKKKHSYDTDPKPLHMHVVNCSYFNVISYFYKLAWRLHAQVRKPDIDKAFKWLTHQKKNHREA